MFICISIILNNNSVYFEKWEKISFFHVKYFWVKTTNGLQAFFWHLCPFFSYSILISFWFRNITEVIFQALDDVLQRYRHRFVDIKPQRQAFYNIRNMIHDTIPLPYLHNKPYIKITKAWILPNQDLNY